MNKKRLEINTTLNSQLSPINNSYFLENLTKQSVCEQYEIDPHYRGWHILQKRQHKLPAVVSDTSLGSTLTAVEQNLPSAIAAIKNQKKTTNLKEDIPKYKVGDEIGVTDEEIAAWENIQPQEFPTCRMKPIEFGKVPIATQTEQILWDQKADTPTTKLPKKRITKTDIINRYLHLDKQMPNHEIHYLNKTVRAKLGMNPQENCTRWWLLKKSEDGNYTPIEFLGGNINQAQDYLDFWVLTKRDNQAKQDEIAKLRRENERLSLDNADLINKVFQLTLENTQLKKTPNNTQVIEGECRPYTSSEENLNNVIPLFPQRPDTNPKCLLAGVATHL